MFQQSVPRKKGQANLSNADCGKIMIESTVFSSQGSSDSNIMITVLPVAAQGLFEAHCS